MAVTQCGVCSSCPHDQPGGAQFCVKCLRAHGDHLERGNPAPAPLPGEGRWHARSPKRRTLALCGRFAERQHLVPDDRATCPKCLSSLARRALAGLLRKAP